MEALPWNPAAEVTDVTPAQSVQDLGGIKPISYAFRFQACSIGSRRRFQLQSPTQ
jgi:hypothetical protein